MGRNKTIPYNWYFYEKRVDRQGLLHTRESTDKMFFLPMALFQPHSVQCLQDE